MFFFSARRDFFVYVNATKPEKLLFDRVKLGFPNFQKQAKAELA
jgi:hypothetical protein|uniref:Uncharacterized protein n=6 Tax=Enterobacteriaceae TaxID=543 RepID=A0A222ZDY1_CROSK|nr:hypothetical protein [Enterobacter cloacae]ALP55043.1 hypothetical protein KPH11_18 [Klebsiella pneumoniae subsp. pneumoniae]APA22993.1 hypothetical protein [Salmonella enterica subsp. enterica serovar Typhimurium]ASR82072.1 Hypothetical protein [Cronobacter sakazakii]AUF80734.1 Hypothetical protein [Raoultella ornithinolytica]QIM11189.1 hypothetical protein [Leclercia sp.]QZX58612.1 hypothetical protein [Klebsiella michiganensis]WGO48864.1 hypothetical protein [Citrobacter freundii]SPN8